MDKYDFYKMGYDVDDSEPEWIDDCASCGKEIYEGERYFENEHIAVCAECYDGFGEM